MSEILETTELTDEMVKDVFDVAGTLPPGGSWGEALGVSPEQVAVWRGRGLAELRRVGRGIRRRVKKSEENCVRFTRLTGLADAEVEAVMAGEGTSDIVPRNGGTTGRPLMLTADLTEAFGQALIVYDTMAAAAAVFGLSGRTVALWRNKGREILERRAAEAMEGRDPGDLDPIDSLYSSFFATIARVEAEKQRSAIDAVRLGFEGARDADGLLLRDDMGRAILLPDWRAADRYMAKRFPRDWREMDAAGDDSSAQIQAAKADKARRPIGVIVLHPAAALTDQLEDDEVVDGVVRETIVPEPQYLDDPDPDSDDLEIFGE